MKILLSTGLQIAIFIVAIIALIVLLFFLGRSAFRGFKEMSQEKYLLFEGILPYKAFQRFLKGKIDNASLSTGFTVLYVSVDKLYNLENSLNQNIMRKILESLLSRIKKHYNNEATIGSYHKGVFLVYLDDEYQYSESMSLAYELMNKMREPYLISQKAELNVSVSIAVAFYPLHSNHASIIIKKLEEVAEGIKKDGGNSVRSCGTSDIFSSEYLDYYSQIKQGISENQFEFYYQPIIKTTHNKVEALAAFIRWNHPELGVLEANKFIHILEQSGDIYWVSIHGLEMICKNYDLLTNITKNDNLHISLIIGNQELGNSNLLKDFKSIIKKYKMDPSKIVLEVTESALIAHEEDPLRVVVKKLKEIGFKIKADVYGISPHELKGLTKDKIDVFKLGRSFIQETDDELSRAYLHMVVDVAKTNNIRLVATQIENEEKFTIYQAAGVECMQGHYFQKPLSVVELKEWCDLENKDKIEESNKDLIPEEQPEDSKDEKSSTKFYDSKKADKSKKSLKKEKSSVETKETGEPELESSESGASKPSDSDLDEEVK